MSAPLRPALIGIPYDASSSYLRGAAAAPPVIRKALTSTAGNPWAERLVATATPDVLEDLGDLALTPDEQARGAIEAAIWGMPRSPRRAGGSSPSAAITRSPIRFCAGCGARTPI